MKMFLVVGMLGIAGCASSSEPRLMTFAEYERLNHPVPYVLQLEAPRGGSLLYFGAEHISGMPSHPQVQKIIELWQSFRPTLALNEGWDPPVAASIEEAVAKYGEPGLVRVLAARDGIPCRNFEPQQAEEVSFLRTRYTAEEIKLFYVLRQVAENWRPFSPEAVNRQVERYLSQLRLIAGLEGRRPQLRRQTKPFVG